MKTFEDWLNESLPDVSDGKNISFFTSRHPKHLIGKDQSGYFTHPTNKPIDNITNKRHPTYDDANNTLPGDGTFK